MLLPMQTELNTFIYSKPESNIKNRVSSSYLFIFFEPIPIFSYFKTKTSYFFYFLAGEAKICNKIRNGI